MTGSMVTSNRVSIGGTAAVAGVNGSLRTKRDQKPTGQVFSTSRLLTGLRPELAAWSYEDLRGPTNSVAICPVCLSWCVLSQRPTARPSPRLLGAGSPSEAHRHRGAVAGRAPGQ